MYNDSSNNHVYNEVGAVDKHVYNVVQGETLTPLTPRSLRSVDLGTSMLSYRIPSSIHLRDSIDNALDLEGFTIRTPDVLGTPETSRRDLDLSRRRHSHDSSTPSHSYRRFSSSDPAGSVGDAHYSYGSHRYASCDRHSVLTAATSLLDSSRSMEHLSEEYHKASTLPIRSRYSYYDMSGSQYSGGGVMMTRSQSINDSSVWFSIDSHLDQRAGRTMFQDLISDINRMCKGISTLAPETEEQSVV